MEIDQFTRALDDKKKISPKSGREYWMARDIQEILGYGSFDSIENVISRAITACKVTGIEPPENHFSQTGKMVSIGSGAKREKGDYFLSRYACYLIAMNGDSSKPEISMAQSYFAIQTRKQEQHEELLLDTARLELRNQVKEHNTYLSGAAKKAGVVNFPKFHSAGYLGLYNGLTVKKIKARKNIPEQDDILDRAGRTELAMNHFRITQTEEKLATVTGGEDEATRIHFDVGQEVRRTVERIQGVMPEDLKPEPHIKEVAKRLKDAKKMLAPKS